MMDLSLLKSFLPAFSSSSFGSVILFLDVKQEVTLSGEHLSYNHFVIFYTVAILFLFTWCFFVFVNNRAKIKNFFTSFTFVEFFLYSFFILIFSFFIKISVSSFIIPVSCDEYPSDNSINGSVFEGSRGRISIENRHVLVYELSYLKERDNITSFDRFIFVPTNGTTENTIFRIPAGQEAFSSLQSQYTQKNSAPLSTSFMIRCCLIANQEGYNNFSVLFEKTGLIPMKLVTSQFLPGSESIQYRNLYLSTFPLEFIGPTQQFESTIHENLYHINNYIVQKFKLMKEFELAYQVKIELNQTFNLEEKENFINLSRARILRYESLQRLTPTNKIIPKIELKSIEAIIKGNSLEGQPEFKKPRNS